MSGDKNNRSKIKLNDDEFNKISYLYQIALDASSQSTLGSGGSSLAGNATYRQKAWHNVQEYMNELGKKYGYDPETCNKQKYKRIGRIFFRVIID